MPVHSYQVTSLWWSVASWAGRLRDVRGVLRRWAAPDADTGADLASKLPTRASQDARYMRLSMVVARQTGLAPAHNYRGTETASCEGGKMGLICLPCRRSV